MYISSTLESFHEPNPLCTPSPGNHQSVLLYFYIHLKIGAINSCAYFHRCIFLQHCEFSIPVMYQLGIHLGINTWDTYILWIHIISIFFSSIILELLFSSFKKYCCMEARWLTYIQAKCLYRRQKEWIWACHLHPSFLLRKLFLKRHLQFTLLCLLGQNLVVCFWTGGRDHLLGICLEMHLTYRFTWKINVV